MVKGPVWDAHSQSQHVRTAHPAHTTDMPAPPSRPTSHTLTTTTTNNNNNNRSLDIFTNDNNSTNISSSISSDQIGTSYLDRYLGVDVSTSASTTEDYSKLKEQFYQSYNPQVGVHTAAVLGGILGWLIVYLLYKTKVKRWVVDFAKNRYAKRQQRRKEKEVCEVFGEFEDHDLNPDPYLFHSPHMTDLHVQQLLQQGFWHPDHLPQHTDYTPHLGDYHPHLQDYCPQQVIDRCSEDRTLPFPQCPVCGVFCEDSMSRHQCPMPSIVVESYTSIPPGDGATGNPGVHNQDSLERNCGGGVNSPKAGRKMRKGEKGRKRKYRRKRSRSHSRPVPGVRVVDVEDLDTKALLPPPCSHSDTVRATARWIQNMPLLMRSTQDVNGLILKVQPHLLGDYKQFSCPLISTTLTYAALPLLGLPHFGWNNSMPALPNHGVDTLKGADNFRGAGSIRSLDSIQGVMDTLPGAGSLQGLDVVKDNADVIFSSDPSKVGVEDEEVHLLQPAPCCVAPRPKSSLVHPHWCGVPSPLPSLRRPLPLRSPSPRLPKHAHVSSSVTNLAVPGSGVVMTSSYSAPASPVPIPVTPTITILHKSGSRGSRGLPGSAPCPDSDLSVSSSSSFDPLTLGQLQPDCQCGHQTSLPQQHTVPSGSKTSSRASWTVFDDDDDDDDDKTDKLSGVGGGSCEREDGGSGREEGACSGHTSCRSDLSSPSLRRSCTTGRSGPHDTVLTVETKL